jgi:hypothetical protein
MFIMGDQKTPVHSVVAVICDILMPLSNDERIRAIDAVFTSLGMPKPRAAPVGELPMVGVSMQPPRTPVEGGGRFEGRRGASVVINPTRPPRTVVVSGLPSVSLGSPRRLRP